MVIETVVFYINSGAFSSLCSCLLYTDAVLPAVISGRLSQGIADARLLNARRCAVLTVSRHAWELCKAMSGGSVSVIVNTYFLLLCTHKTSDRLNWRIACESQSSHVAGGACLPLTQLNWILSSIVVVNVVTNHRLRILFFKLFKIHEF